MPDDSRIHFERLSVELRKGTKGNDNSQNPLLPPECSKNPHEYEKERKKGQNFFQWLESKPDDYFKRLELANGGKVIDFSKYKKSKNPKIKKLDLASAFDHAKTISSLTDDERDLVIRMLRMSLGKDE